MHHGQSSIQHSMSLAQGRPFSDLAMKYYISEDLKGWNSALGKTDFLIRFAGKLVMDLLCCYVACNYRNGTLHSKQTIV